MTIFCWILGWGLAFLWLERLASAALGMPKVADLAEDIWAHSPARGEANPRVCVVVPARNEESGIEPAMGSLMTLEYPNYEVIAVNDRSTDSTGEILERVAAANASKLRVLHVHGLPPRWLGKPHAMWRGAQLASVERPPEWFLFTDADVVFRADALCRAVAYAEKSGCDHLAIFPTMITESVGERMMIAFFQAFFLFAARPWKVHDPKSRDYLGIGAFNLVRAAAYQEIGGCEALRMEVIEDMKLGRLIKQHGFTPRAAFGRNLLRLRWARGAMGMVRNLSKNFFAFMKFEWWRALGAAIAVALVSVAPFAGAVLAPGWAKLGFGLALFGIFGLYAGMATKCEIKPWYFLLHPPAALLFSYSILRSMVVTLWRGGVVWRGTSYPLEELRRATD